MAEKTGAAVNARILYWGVPGAGVSSTLRHLSSKLRPDHRGELQEIPTRLDPTVSYEILPIKLGLVGGVDTRIEIVAVPGEDEHGPTRKQLLDRADGVVFVVDARRERSAETVARFEELRRALAAYGRKLENLPLVIQANRRDASDPSALDELLRKLDVTRVPCFETVAAEGAGVLQVLSTISKAVVRSLRDQPGRTPTAPAAQSPAAATAPAPTWTPAAAPPAARAAAPASSPVRDVTPPPSPALPPLRAPAARSEAMPPAPRPSAPPPIRSLVREPSPPMEEWPAPLRPRRPVTAPAAASAPPPAARPPFSGDERTGRLAPEAASVKSPAAASLRIVAVGHGSCDDQRTVQLPLELQDAEGRRFRVTLSLAIGPALTGGD